MARREKYTKTRIVYGSHFHLMGFTRKGAVIQPLGMPIVRLNPDQARTLGIWLLDRAKDAERAKRGAKR